MGWNPQVFLQSSPLNGSVQVHGLDIHEREGPFQHKQQQHGYDCLTNQKHTGLVEGICLT